ncbi:MAG: chemoreceptor glutamine deamidase CheD [Betaproteobacteria bacterium]|nr:chemoreceptor glutamine deamidase CheD [Betaproteobacteria bacterium]HMV22114.1 chemoreceptor glutamine deamidase CheD [Rhodocyclaceae bacterium]HNE43541.1 chemoreceptor glutamine deamidase CheD [Rhodocyclaceae bacterium]HNL20479.1 chemoreceptor glutamine deamidase CheD [Rhodocyclaceae bacterium]HNM21389.1 chemoreceptor glutamine deamidase CheD [Rhodocyclaceae bacterium]
MTAHAFDEHLATNRYFDRHFESEAAKILPGEYFVTTKDMLLVTVLGSCVAACIRDPDSGIGGMNHFMLPDEGGREVLSTSARYGTYAMEVLINHLLKLGARRNRLEAKVFGGGAVMESLASSNVGVRNAEFVLKFLNTEKVPVVAKDLLDSYPRKVYYFPSTGKVLVKKLHRVHNDTLFSREREYKERLVTAKVEGDVELFI